MKNAGIDYELVDFCEVDKYAETSYCAVHNVSKEKNLGDITKVSGKDLLYADLMVWGFPCTDISVAGARAGIIEGKTRSGLYYEGLRILKETMPKYSIIENVKNLVGKKFKAQFETMLEDLKELGYNNYWQVLNSKDYGIPQNRERVFIVSIRSDVDTGKFEFPQGADNGLRLKDFLEVEVGEKFYVSQEKTEKLISQLKDKSKFNKNENNINVIGNLGNTGHHGLDVYLENGISPTLKARDYKDPVRVAVMPCITPERVEKRQMGEFKEDGDPAFTINAQDRHSILIAGESPNEINVLGRLESINGHDLLKRVYDINGISPTLDSCSGGNRQPKIAENKCIQLGSLDQPGYHEFSNRVYSIEGAARTLMGGGGNLNDKAGQYLIDYKIRRLTPKECWRLMGFSDEDFQKAQDAKISNSQLYKQAGNSIVTNVLREIFKSLLLTTKQ